MAKDSTRSHRIFPHGALESVADGVWQVRGSLPSPLPRLMTVHRLPDGSLFLHSVIALEEEGMRALEDLGVPSVMLVPHPMHLMDAPFYRARYPNIEILAPADAAASLQGRARVDASPDARLPALGIAAHVVPGLRYSEVVPELPLGDGKTALVFTDIFVAGDPGGPSMITNALLRLLGPPRGCGVPRLVRYRQVTDRAAVRGFFRALADRTDVSLLLGAHTKPVRERCQEVLLRAASSL